MLTSQPTPHAAWRYRASPRLRLRRWLAGCYYLGCFAPAGFAVLLIWIVLDRLRRLLSR